VRRLLRSFLLPADRVWKALADAKTAVETLTGVPPSFFVET